MAKNSKPSQEELLAFTIKQEENASSYLNDEVAIQQAKNMDRYNRAPYGDEIGDRSKAITSDVFDSIQWSLPYITSVLTRKKELITVKPSNEEEEKHVEDVAEHISHVMFTDNDMAKKIKQFALEGLINIVGVFETHWVTNETKPNEEIKGADDALIEQYEQDKEWNIVGAEIVIDDETRIAEVSEEEIQLLQQSGANITYNLEVEHNPQTGRISIDLVRPEEFLISKDATGLDDTNYCGTKTKVYLKEIGSEFPTKLEEILTAGSGGFVDTDVRTIARGIDQNSVIDLDQDDHQPTGVLHKEYVRYDLNGDGIVELLHIKRIGDVILEVVEVDDNPYSSWCPFPENFKFYGKSMAQIAAASQYNRTLLLRTALDGAMASGRPRLGVNSKNLTPKGADALFDNDIGGIIAFNGTPEITPIVTPDMSGALMQQLEYQDQEREARTGITRHSQGLDPAGIAKTARGQEMLIDASDVRKEDMAIECGQGVQDVARKVLALLCKHQNYSRKLMFKDKWVEFDPRKWSSKMSVTIHAGLSAGNKQQQSNGLFKILDVQYRGLEMFGPDNDLVDVAHINNTANELVKAIGYSDPSKFFKEQPTDEEIEQRKAQEQEAQANQDPRSPEQIEAEGKAQMNMQKMQFEEQRKLEIARADIARKDAIVQSDIQRKAQQIEAELKIASWQKNAELELQQGQKVAELNLQVAVKSAEIDLETQLAGKKLDTDVTLSKTHIGGSAAV